MGDKAFLYCGREVTISVKIDDGSYRVKECNGTTFGREYLFHPEDPDVEKVV